MAQSRSRSNVPRENAGEPAGLRRAIEKHSNLIAALATLAAAILGFVLVFVNEGKTDAQDDVVGLRQRVGALEQQVEQRDGTIKSLQDTTRQRADDVRARDERIAELETQLRGQGLPVPATDSPPIRHQGEVALANAGDAIDINSSGDDPAWGTGTLKTFEDGAVSLSYGNLSFQHASIAALRGGAKASYETCSRATGYADAKGVDADSLEGSNICIRTDAKRFATVRLTDQSDDMVRLNITTWEMASD